MIPDEHDAIPVVINFRTQNLAVLPTRINAVSSIKRGLRTNDRMHDAAQQLKTNEIHVACFQEFFDDKKRRKFVEYLNARNVQDARSTSTQKASPYYCYSPENVGKKIGSGLFILSKFPIVSYAFLEFKDKIGPDCFSHKGIAFVELNINNTPLYIFNTNLQASPDLYPTWWPEYLFHVNRTRRHAEDVRRSNLLQMREFIVSIAQKMLQQGKPWKNIFICGDFNIKCASDEYYFLLDALDGPLDVLCSLKYNGNARTAAQDTTYKGSRLDYIFGWHDPSKLQLLDVAHVLLKSNSGKHLSDHKGVQLQLALV